MASATAQSLHNEYVLLQHKLRENFKNLQQEDKKLASHWLNRLNAASTKIGDLKKRNQILMSLTLQAQLGKLSPPFDKPPNFNTLDEVQNVPEMNHETIFPEGFKLPLIMDKSPDHGAFLVSQPVPKCGAFCYLAVVSRPINK